MVTTINQIWILVLKNIVAPVSAQVDFIKDLTQVALLTVAVGGPKYVLYHATSFSSVVIICLLLSIFVPLLVAGILLRRRTSSKPVLTKLDYIKAIPMTMIEPIRLQFRLIAARFARCLALKRNDISLFGVSNDAIDGINITLAEYSRNLLGLEAIYQLLGNAILLFYSYSETRTSQGTVYILGQ